MTDSYRPDHDATKKLLLLIATLIVTVGMSIIGLYVISTNNFYEVTPIVRGALGLFFNIVILAIVFKSGVELYKTSGDARMMKTWMQVLRRTGRIGPVYDGVNSLWELRCQLLDLTTRDDERNKYVDNALRLACTKTVQRQDGRAWIDADELEAALRELESAGASITERISIGRIAHRIRQLRMVGE